MDDLRGSCAHFILHYCLDAVHVDGVCIIDAFEHMILILI